MINIFDLSNVDDIEEEVRKDLSVDVFGNNIVKLFDLAERDLSVDEITVAYCRKYEPKTKKQIMGKVYNMSRARNPQIKSVKGQKGIYRKVK